ncbi:MAG: hypothetical protein H6679_02510 [Epsilonproteobacteria bacterium]|nr:hypothetical protein [Campylobacterota bacterium]
MKNSTKLLLFSIFSISLTLFGAENDPILDQSTELNSSDEPVFEQPSELSIMEQATQIIGEDDGQDSLDDLFFERPTELSIMEEPTQIIDESLNQDQDSLERLLDQTTQIIDNESDQAPLEYEEVIADFQRKRIPVPNISPIKPNPDLSKKRKRDGEN